MKKTLLLLIVAFVFLAGCQAIDVEPGFNTVESGGDLDELIVDPRCSAYMVSDPPEPGEDPECSTLCTRRCVSAGKSCTYPSNTNCPTVLCPYAELTETINLFGADFGPPSEAFQRIVRLALMAVFSLIGLVAILYGLYGMLLRTTAAENPEKVELSAKVFKNALIGVLISFVSVVIIQLAAMALGIEDNLFELNIIPDNLVITAGDVECGTCRTGQTALAITEDGARGYECLNNRWVPTGGGFIPRD
ncbi:MAG: hypothetical protein ACE5DX_04815 [Candidatus Dojkabacteria bacterium]